MSVIPTPERHGRFVREHDAAVASLLDGRTMSGRSLEVEVRDRPDLPGVPDISILWRAEVPLAARIGASVVVGRGTDPAARATIERAARARGLALDTMAEGRLWKLLGVPS